MSDKPTFLRAYFKAQKKPAIARQNRIHIFDFYVLLRAKGRETYTLSAHSIISKLNKKTV